MTTIAFLVALAAAGHDEYENRIAASKVLARAVRQDPARYGPALDQAARSNPSAEVRTRCQVLTRPYWRHLADGYQPGDWPRLDYSGMDVEDVAAWVFAAYEEAGNTLPPPDSVWNPFWFECVYETEHLQRRACEMYVRDRIGCGAWTTRHADHFLMTTWAAEKRP